MYFKVTDNTKKTHKKVEIYAWRWRNKHIQN